MPKILSDADFAPVLAAIHPISAPASIEQIHAQLKQIPRRTLQRRLARLTEQGLLAPYGERGGRRYLLRETEPSRIKENSERSYHGGILLSPEALEIRQAVTRPISARRPVGYQVSFLRKYRPNVSNYLLPAHLRKLNELGDVGANAQPAGTYFRKVLDRLLIDLSWNSSRLEGNTYSLLETERLLALGESAEGKDAKEAQMILNHKAAIELLAEQADEIGFNRYTICNLHALLADNLLPHPGAAGRLRSSPIGITGAVYHPLETPQLVEEYFHLFLTKADAIANAFEQAFFAMIHLPYLQPFDDVNKRVSRLAANIPLVRRNLCPLSFVDVPQADYVNGIIGVYELNRVEYLRDVFLWAYERSCARYAAIRQSLGEPDAFRVKYRTKIGDSVVAVVRGGKSKKSATQWIARGTAMEIPTVDRMRFIEAVETELIHLHEGNIARYRLRPAEFHSWHANWS